MESTPESSQQEEASAGGPLHEEQSLSAGRVTEDNGVSINASDVLCGRGKTSFNHVGNKRFRELISASLSKYMQAENRFEKSIVVHTIVDGIQSNGGRFLKKNSATGKWVELQHQQAKDKVGHAIRDAVNSFEMRRERETKMNQLKELDSAHQHPHMPTFASIDSYQHIPRTVAVNLQDALASRATLQHLPYPGGLALGSPAAAALMEYHHHHRHPHGLEQLQQQPHHFQTQQLPHYHPMQQHAGHLHQLQPDQQHNQFHQNPPGPRGREEKEKHEHHFLQHIDEVLGPLPPNAKDPMEPFLDEQDRQS